MALVDDNENSISDLWEKLYNSGQLYPSTFLPEADADGDGFSNIDEATTGKRGT
jgi:hypothetical protein